MSVSTSQIEHGQCPICLDSMSKTDEHQISSLPCGHMFGNCCIKRWIEDENHQFCPICRKDATTTKIRPLVWNGFIPLDTGRSEEIAEDSKRSVLFHQKLLQKFSLLERDWCICESEIASRRRSIFSGNKSSRTSVTIVPKPVSFPSLILERPMLEGFRVKLTPKHLFCTCQNRQNNIDYGIEFCELSNPSEFRYIPAHEAQIHDLKPSPYDKEQIATVSSDKSLIVTAIRSEMTILESHCPIPLWSCAWISPNSLAVGGIGGRFFIIDGRGEISKEFELIKGPPIFSIDSFSDNTLIVSSPLKTALFDIRKNEFIKMDIPEYSTGAQAVRVAKNATGSPSLRDQHFVIMNKIRNSYNGQLRLGTRYSSTNKVSISYCGNIEKYDKLAMPDVITIPNGGNSQSDNQKNPPKDIIAIPEETTNSFKLLSSTNMQQDLWGKWKSSFSNPNFPSPILDISLSKETDFYLAAVSSELLRLYAFPI